MAKKTRRLALAGSVVASVVLALSLAACGGGQGQSPQPSSGQSSQMAEQPSEQAPEQAGGLEVPQPPTDVSGGKPWIDSNLKDNIKPGMETSPKDDFYLYVNYDWLLNTNIPEGDRVAGMGLDEEGRDHAAKAVSGGDLTGIAQQRHQIVLAVRAIRHRSEYRHGVTPGVDLPQQAVHRLLQRVGAQLLQQ